MSKRNRVIALLLIIILFVACTGGAKNKAPQKDAVVETVPTKGEEILTDEKATKVEEEKAAHVESQDDEDLPEPTAEVEETTSSKRFTLNKDVTVTENIIYEKDDIKVTVKSLAFDGWMGPELKLLAENGTDKTFTLQAEDVVINGFMIDSYMSAEVAPGKKVNDELTITRRSLEIANIETIQYIELRLRIIDFENYTNTFSTDRIRIETNADQGYVQTVDDSGQLMAERDGIRIILKRLDTEDSFWGAELYVFVENNSETDISVQVRDVSVNGFMISPSFHAEVLSGTKVFDKITFFEKDLEDNDIVDIEELELYFHVFEKDGWNTLFDTEVIKVTFQ